MSWIIIVPGTFIIIYGLGIYLWDKRVTLRISKGISRRLNYLHYSLVTLTIIAVFLNIIDDISFSGQWTTRTIIFGLLFTGILIYPLTNWKGKTKFEKYYFRLFSLLPIVTAVFSLIPFLGMVIVVSLVGQLVDPVGKIYYEDNKLRVQSTFIGVLGPLRLDVIEKNGFLERRLNKSHRGADMDSVSINKMTDKTLVLLYYEQEVKDTIKVKKIE
jgi:hypothetical protein